MRTNLFFLKVPKCASGTTMVILWNFVISHNLNPLITSRGLPGFGAPLSSLPLVGVPEGEDYNVLATHMDYKTNRDEIRKIMPKDTFYVGITRDPLSHFQSVLVWARSLYKRLRKEALRDFKNVTSENIVRLVIEHSPSDLKRAVGHQVSYYGIEANNIDSGVQATLRTFDLILIVEFYDESLVLLKRYMCWELKDIVYSRKHVQVYQTNRVIPLTDPVTQQWFDNNDPDSVLYRKSVEEFHRKVKAEGGDFQEEVKQFQSILTLINSFCASESGERLTVEESQWNSAFHFYYDECSALTESTTVSISQIRQWQKNKLKK